MAGQRGDLQRLLQKSERLVAGLISGTSADGIDCAIARIGGSGAGMSVDVLAFVTVPYAAVLREAVLRNCDVATSSVRAIAQLNFRLAIEFKVAIESACALAGVDAGHLDLVGSHGQTIHHVPDPEEVAGMPIRATLQIGDPSVLANVLGITVVGDFRVADMALGGQGAPLVPYADHVLFGHASTDRILLNLGGIANITVLEAGSSPAAVVAFDTGPANMIIDGLVQKHFGVAYDDEGTIGSSGTVFQPLLDEMLADPYFSAAPPKSTGRERFGADYVTWLEGRAAALDLSVEDVVATATELTATSVAIGIRDFTPLAGRPFELVVGGGGVHNRFLMDRLRAVVPAANVITTGALGIDPDAREAVCFAIMAHETLNGMPTAIPAVTGATQAGVLGKICLPSIARVVQE